MANSFNKTVLATGKDTSGRFDLSCFHATTTTFYNPRVTYFHEFVPGEHWNMDARCSVRCLPLIKPMIADVKVHNRFFYVPYYSIMNHFNDFLAESPISSSGFELRHNLVPFTYEFYFLRVFALPRYSTRYETMPDSYDFVFGESEQNRNWLVLTPLGRTLFSILSGLGYSFNFKCNATNMGNKLSLLPLLAYLKVYLDWYNNPAFDAKRELEAFFDVFYTSGNPSGEQDLIRICDNICHTYLERDYFTSSTLYPIGSNSPTMQLDHTIVDITASDSSRDPLLNIKTTLNNNTHGTPVVEQVHSNFAAVTTKYSLDAVNALTDYVKRHQLAGIQPFNRILAEYGVTLKDEELKRSTYIGEVVEDLDVKSVISQGYADDTVLGERAGIADGGNSKKLDYKNANFGAIICVTTVVPKTSYPDGIKRHCLRTERFDFFTPSVEHLGTEPVYCAELYNRFAGNENVLPMPPGAIFGYLPRYAAYKTALDSISGDFCLNSRRSFYDPWILQRKIDTTSRVDLASISEDFVSADPSKVSQVFANNDSDNFIIFNMYHVSSQLPMHQLYDDYQWSNEEDNPQHVTLPNQGVQLS